MTTNTDMREALQACADAMLHDGVLTDSEHPKRIALNAAEAALASRPDAQAESGASQDESDLCERIIHAVEGECDGLAITEEQASDILAYLQYGAPMNDVRRDAERYRKLRAADINAIHEGGIFVGLTPNNVVINGDDLDIAVDLLIDDAAAPSPDREQVGEDELYLTRMEWFNKGFDAGRKEGGASPSRECGERQWIARTCEHGNWINGCALCAASTPTLGDANPTAEPPRWYSVDEIRSRLKSMAYGDEIADELSTWFTTEMQLAFNKGFEKGQHAPAVAQPRLTDEQRGTIRYAAIIAEEQCYLETAKKLRSLLSQGE